METSSNSAHLLLVSTNYDAIYLVLPIVFQESLFLGCDSLQLPELAWACFSPCPEFSAKIRCDCSRREICSRQGVGAISSWRIGSRYDRCPIPARVPLFHRFFGCP